MTRSARSSPPESRGLLGRMTPGDCCTQLSGPGGFASTRPGARPLIAVEQAAGGEACSLAPGHGSTLSALAQPGGVALGAQAGPAAVRQLADNAGFSRFRQVTQTPVNVVLELQP